MEYTWDFGVVLANFPVLLRGVLLTLELWAIALALGLALGCGLGLAHVSRRAWLNGTAIAYVEIFRNTPVLVPLILFFYALPIVLGVQLTPFAAAVLALTLHSGAYYAEVFRGGIQSIA